MTIEMGKKYRTRDGQDVRILCVDAPGSRPVISLVDNNLCRWTEDGHFWIGRNNHHMDLIEVTPYSDIAIDAPGWARDADKNSQDHKWQPVHFARVGENGKPLCFAYGGTSHSTLGKTFEWDEFTTKKPEGL
jgi:hypothetical protein